MKTLGLASFAVALLAALAVHAGDDAQKKEQAALEGKWKVVSFETPKGKDANLEGAIFEFDKDGKKLSFTHNGETKKGIFKLNLAAKPKEIDIDPSDENKTFKGIYALDKNTLKLCLCPEDGAARPDEFALKDGKNHVLVVMERTK